MPRGGEGPAGGLAKLTVNVFGRLERLEKAFADMAVAHFGSNWPIQEALA